MCGKKKFVSQQQKILISNKKARKKQKMLSRNSKLFLNARRSLLAKCNSAAMMASTTCVSSASAPMVAAGSFNNNNNSVFYKNNNVATKRFYSAKSHFHGILYSMYFVFEAFKKAIDEMQATEANTAISMTERSKQLHAQFNMFQSGLKAWTNLERSGYVTALHHKIQKRETAHASHTSDVEKDLSHHLPLETIKQHHAKETHQIEKCAHSLYELKKHAHDAAAATNYLGQFSDELRALKQMLVDHVQWEELQLLPLITKHFTMREMTKVHLEAMQQLKQGETSSVAHSFSKNNLQLCETMVREILKSAEGAVAADVELSDQLLAEMKKHIDPKMWSELKQRIPELENKENDTKQ